MAASAEEDPFAPSPFVRATGAFEQGDLPQADALLAPLAADEAAPAEVFALLGRVRLRQNRPAEAAAAFERALALNPASAPVRSHLGLVLVLQAEVAEGAVRGALLERARGELERAVRDEESCLDAQMGLLRLFLVAPESGPSGAAERCAARAAELDPLTATYEVAELAEQKGRFDLAERYYAAAHRLFPDNPWIAFKQATMLARVGQLAEARRRLEDLVARLPGFGPAGDALRQLPAS